MRLAYAIVTVLLSACIVSAATERAWQTGTWAESHDDDVLVIETARDLVILEKSGTSGERHLAASPGTPVQFAVERQTVYVLDSAQAEHSFVLRRRTPKYSTEYAALGGGHYIKSVAPDGAFVTLEDGSRWDMDPLQRFVIAGWHPDDLISIRRSTDDPAFAFEVDNTSEDEGTLANLRVR